MSNKPSLRGRRRSPHHAWGRYIGANDGTAAVEFAIIAPIFFTMVIGVIVYGLYFTVWIAVTQIASEAARAGLAGLTTAEQTSIATTRFNTGLASYAPMLSASKAALTFPTASAGTFAVAVSYDFSSFGFSVITLLPLPAAKPSITITVSTGSP
jgi:Flp pilus assembly protein TadG